MKVINTDSMSLFAQELNKTREAVEEAAGEYSRAKYKLDCATRTHKTVLKRFVSWARHNQSALLAQERVDMGAKP
jgi:hypothetical protein